MSLSDCEIDTETTNIKLFAEEGFWFHPKRIGVYLKQRMMACTDCGLQYTIYFSTKSYNGYRKSN